MFNCVNSQTDRNIRQPLLIYSQSYMSEWIYFLVGRELKGCDVCIFFALRYFISLSLLI